MGKKPGLRIRIGVGQGFGGLQAFSFDDDQRACGFFIRAEEGASSLERAP